MHQLSLKSKKILSFTRPFSHELSRIKMSKLQILENKSVPRTRIYYKRSTHISRWIYNFEFPLPPPSSLKKIFQNFEVGHRCPQGGGLLGLRPPLTGSVKSEVFRVISGPIRMLSPLHEKVHPKNRHIWP